MSAAKPHQEALDRLQDYDATPIHLLDPKPPSGLQRECGPVAARLVWDAYRHGRVAQAVRVSGIADTVMSFLLTGGNDGE